MIVRPEGEMYQRQNLLAERLQVMEHATVVGVGGTGFWTAIFLAMSGVPTICLIDSDNVEATNLNRLPLTADMLNRNKANACKDFIRRLRPGIRVVTFLEKVMEANIPSLIGSMTSVFCCTDNFASQQMLQAYCKAHNIPYQRIGYDGTTLNVSRAFPMTFKDTVQEGYTQTPSWVVPAVLAAAAGVSSVLHEEITLMDDLSTLDCKTVSTLPRSIVGSIEQKAQQAVRDNPEAHGLGYCEDCEERHGDGYGYCPDCGRLDQYEARASLKSYVKGLGAAVSGLIRIGEEGFSYTDYVNDAAEACDGALGEFNVDVTSSGTSDRAVAAMSHRRIFSDLRLIAEQIGEYHEHIDTLKARIRELSSYTIYLTEGGQYGAEETPKV